MANEISSMPATKKKNFDSKVNKLIRNFPGNRIVKEKTISNWRTEISSLFGFILHDRDKDIEEPSLIAKQLAEKQDLVEFFKYFCFTFQYPGGHLKTQEIKKIIDKNIRFKPVKYILQLLKSAKESDSIVTGITKAEATHCILNDLRVTRGERTEKECLKLIEQNRRHSVSYDWSGDVIRYAGDILDYMYYANLLKKHGGNYCLNKSELEVMLYLLKDKSYFTGFEKFYGKTPSPSELVDPRNEWGCYLNERLPSVKFETNILSYIGVDVEKYKQLDKLTGALNLPEFREVIKDASKAKTKEIGDTGESLVHGHECMKLKLGGRTDLISRVVCLPNHIKIGYDIISYELDEKIRCIEVKTTISNTSIDFNKFHLTDNEWNVAQNHKERYFVYRLAITRQTVKLFIIRNPVEKYKEGKISISMSNGVEVKFQKNAGRDEELLIWEE